MWFLWIIRGVSLSLHIAISVAFDLEEKNHIIPKRYNKYATPLKSEKKPTAVYIAILVTDIDHILEEKMEYSMHFYLHEYWIDPRLNLTCFEPLDEMPKEWYKDLWTPDIIFQNLKQGFIPDLSVPNIVIRVMKYGYLNRLTMYSMKVACPMLLETYPMDTQNCHLYLSSLANDDSKMQLKWFQERIEDPEKMRNLVLYENKPLKFQITGALPGAKIEAWPNGNYTSLYANFTFRRRLSSHVFNFYLPSGLVVVLSFASFWFEVRAVSGRLTIGLTSLLTLSTQAWEAHGNLPPISYLTALDIWLFACVLHVFATLLMYACLQHRYTVEKSSNSRRRVSRASETSSKRSKKAFNRDFPPPADDYEVQPLDKISRVLFPTVFTLFALIYWIYFMIIIKR